MWIPGFGSDELRPFKKQATTEAHKQVSAKKLFQILAVIVIIGLIHNCKKIFATNLLAVTYMDEKYRNKGSTLKLFVQFRTIYLSCGRLKKEKIKTDFGHLKYQGNQTWLEFISI